MLIRLQIDLLKNPGLSAAEQKWQKEASKKAAKARKQKRLSRSSSVPEEDATDDPNDDQPASNSIPPDAAKLT